MGTVAVVDKILKQTPSRSVRLERRGETWVVVKRFRHADRWARPFDGARAKREFEILEHLAARGVRVPHPLSLESRDGGCEVVMQWIANATSLRDRLSRGERERANWARSAGHTLAALHAAGIDHRDLHAGNLLLCDDGGAWAIDFDKARRRRAFRPAWAERDLSVLAAGLREWTSLRWRAAALAAWRREAVAQGLQLPACDAAHLEARARELRRAVVAQRARRHLAGGRAIRPLERGRGVAVVELGAEYERALLDGATPPGVIRVCGRPAMLRGLWTSMARLGEHGVAAPRPLAWATRAPSRAWFRRASNDARESRPIADPGAAARARGRFVGAMIDRGLWCEGLAPEHVDAHGLREPLAVFDAEFAANVEQLRATLDVWAQGRRAEFLAGFASAWRGPASEWAALLETS